MTTAHETLVSDLAGHNYSDVRDKIQTLDWSDCYPVVDIDGNLTGEVADAQSVEHLIVDCTSTGVAWHPQAADAMVLESEFRAG